jgi:hypothetical protein
MVNKTESELAFVYADTTVAGQAQKDRFPRGQAIRSFFCFLDATCTQAAVILETLSGLEVIGEIKAQWDDHEVVVRGDEIAVTQWAFYGTTPIVGGGGYLDHLAAGATLDFDAIFRIPIGASQLPTTNIEVTVTMMGEAVWSETVASTTGAGTLYIAADYVDNVSVAYDTWNDTMDNLAAETERGIPLKGDTFVGFSVVCRDDYAAYTVSGIVRDWDTYAANYEDALTTIKVNVGERVIDINQAEAYRVPAWLHRRKPPTAVTTEQMPEAIDMVGNYWVPINLAVNAIPRIRLNAGTTDARLNVWYSSQNGAGPEVGAQAGSGAQPGEGKAETGQKTTGSSGTGPTLNIIGGPGGVQPQGFLQPVRRVG